MRTSAPAGATTSAAAPVRRVIIHGHFYQPPREDPWLGVVPEQKGAAPWHDWNEKIERECYRTVVAARVLDADGRVARVINTLSRMSFDVGPTLFEWMERAAPATYTAILEADAESVARTGHGNAIAQPYHHVILPLASRRDKVTEVRWGIADFERRFRRRPVGLWLPETAVDDETLDVLAQEGIAFTILAPSQVRVPPPLGAMGQYTTANGRSIAIGVYDADLSHGIAFGRLLKSAREWESEVLRGIQTQTSPSVVAMATDGETYGHHHHFSEMALASLLDMLDENPVVEVTNYAAVLATTGAHQDVELIAPSSWSCPHGIERWYDNCGCRIAQELAPAQEWRKPLRQGLEALRKQLDAQWERETLMIFRDPAAARDGYGAVVATNDDARHAFAREHAATGLASSQLSRAVELLELARDGLRMFTSCAWFFDDVTGLEVAQNLCYAARSMHLAGEWGPPMERELLRYLTLAHASAPASVTAGDVWTGIRRRRELTSQLLEQAALTRVASGVATLSSETLAAFEGAVAAIPQDATAARATRATELLDLLDLLGHHIPFDVQTTFARALARTPASERKHFTALAERLGFSKRFSDAKE